ncbi:SRPBCC family protein [Luteimonas suaedae]|uniref:SRPBCC family protein n=1 Tax=Luteimonas suaedae TaxID=2605430 RepID=UPI0011EFBA70|nr:SRPBCC family protein [Luteimonas suaedae]
MRMEVREHWRRNMELLMRTVAEEDFLRAEGIQANLATGMTPDLLFGRNEAALLQYHGTIAEMLRPQPRPMPDYAPSVH